MMWRRSFYPWRRSFERRNKNFLGTVSLHHDASESSNNKKTTPRYYKEAKREQYLSS